MPRDFAKPETKNVTPADEPKEEAPEEAPELKRVTSDDVGEQTKTKADEKE